MPRRNRNQRPPETEAVEIWYRAEVNVHEVGVSDLEYGRYRSQVLFEEYPVVRRTPCGVYLRDYQIQKLWRNEDPDHHSNLRWVANGARKAFAYPTKFLALRSLQIRKSRYVTNCRRRLTIAQIQNEAARTHNLVEGE